jgi:hypothetical protein
MLRQRIQRWYFLREPNFLELADRSPRETTFQEHP